MPGPCSNEQRSMFPISEMKHSLELRLNYGSFDGWETFAHYTHDDIPLELFHTIIVEMLNYSIHKLQIHTYLVFMCFLLLIT